MKNQSILAAKVATIAAVALSAAACDTVEVRVPESGATVSIIPENKNEEQPEAKPSAAPDSGSKAPGDKDDKPTVAKPPKPAPSNTQSKGSGLNVIDISDKPVEFSVDSLDTNCLMATSSVHCYVHNLPDYDLDLDDSKICDPNSGAEGASVNDAVLAEGKFWFDCSTEPNWHDYITGDLENVAKLHDWVDKDKTKSHKRTKSESIPPSAPELLPNTKLVAGEYSCTTGSTNLACKHSGTGASFTIVPGGMRYTGETDSYPRPANNL